MDTFLNLTEIYNDIHNKNCKIVCICSCTVSVYGKPRMCYIEFVYDKIKKQYKIQYANNIICAFHSHKYQLFGRLYDCRPRSLYWSRSDYASDFPEISPIAYPGQAVDYCVPDRRNAL